MSPTRVIRESIFPKQTCAILALIGLLPWCESRLQAQFDPDNPIPAVIQHGPMRVDLRPVVGDLVSPVMLTFSPDGTKRLFVVEQTGKIVIVKNGKKVAVPFLDLSSRMVTLNPAYDERGLLGFAFDPGFTDSASPGYRRVFTYSSEPVSGTADLPDPYATTLNHHGVIASWRVSADNPDVVDTTSRVEILRIDEPQSNHNGGTILFGPDGYLYIGFGDGGGANDSNPNGHNPTIGNGQDLTVALGKMLRIDVNGTNSANGKYGIPPTNPYAESGGLKEIYASGFRNPYRFSFDGADLWVADVGQNKVEELDRVEIGKNYGWRYKEGAFKFSTDGTISDDLSGLPEGLVDPILQYDHDEGASITGGFVYRGAAIPELVGKYVFGDFSRTFGGPEGRLFCADLTTREIREFIIGVDDQPLGLFVKGFGIDADGEIYLLGTKNVGPQGTTGVVLKLVTQPVFTTGAPLPRAGENGIPEDAVFKSFGVPGINDAGEIAFAAGYKSSDGKGTVLLGPLGQDRTSLGTLVKAGDQAPGANGQPSANPAIFAGFSDPVLAGNGRVAFVGKLRNSKSIPATKDTGIWTNADSGVLHLLAQEGEVAPGTDGARFKSFTSVAMSDVQGGVSVLAFTAQLGHSGGVNNSNDTGLWRSVLGEAPVLVLREKQTIEVSGTSRTVKSFKALAPDKVVSGQANGAAGGLVSALVTFTDGTQAVLQVAGEAEFNLVAIEGESALDGEFAAFRSVIQAPSGRVAFVGDVEGPTKQSGVFAQIQGLHLVAESGEAATGTDGLFSKFGPVSHSDGAGTAFLATISGGAVKASTDTGLWWEKDDVVRLIAREGDPAADAADGKWSGFKSLAMADSGPLFIADLAPGSGVKPSNKTGLWAMGSDSNVHLLLRTGQPVELGGETKTLRAFTVLSVVRGSPAQTRSVNSAGQLIYRAQFTDGTQSVQILELP